MSLTRSSNDNIRSARFRTRGAALVEAAVVLPVMVAMLGLTMMMFSAYMRKLTENQEVRSEVLDYASHACQSQDISYGGTSKGGGSFSTGSSGIGANDGVSSGALGASGGSTKVSGIMNTASVSYPGSTVNNPTPTSALRGSGMSIQVKGATSYALCNEVPEDGDLGGLFSYAKNQLGGQTSQPAQSPCSGMSNKHGAKDNCLKNQQNNVNSGSGK